MRQHRQKELNAIKAKEKVTPVSEQFSRARELAEKGFGIKYNKSLN